MTKYPDHSETYPSISLRNFDFATLGLLYYKCLCNDVIMYMVLCKQLRCRLIQPDQFSSHTTNSEQTNSTIQVRIHVLMTSVITLLFKPDLPWLGLYG